MAKTTFTLDAGKAINKLLKLNNLAFEAAKKGVGRAMLQVKTDTIMQRPTAPLDEGFLRGSASIFVNNESVNQPPSPGEKTGKRVTSYSIRLKKFQIVGVIGFNVPYAARWHEVPANFKEPTAGNKYLEVKLVNNRNTYRNIVGNAVKETLENKG